MHKISLLLVDDHQLVMDAWTSILNSDDRFQVVGAATNAEDAYRLAAKFRPHIILCDINLTPIDGIEITKQMHIWSPLSKVIAVSMHSIPAYTKKMLYAGAMGYVTKNSTVEEMKLAISEVYAGRRYICQEIKHKLAVDAFEPGTAVDSVRKLTRKELDVIQFIKKGLSSREIACSLTISLKTVEVHRYNILKKLGMPNTAALVNFINIQGL